MNVTPGKSGRIRYDWWRAHHGLPGHAKWRAVARAAQVPVSVAFHIVVCLLDTASRGHPRGSLGEFKPFDCAGIVDVPVDKVDRVVEVLREVHWIEGHMIAEWDDRQPAREDRTNAIRQANWRSRKGGVTQRYEDDSNTTHALQTDLSRNGSVTNEIVTTANAPDRDKDILSSETTAAHASLVENHQEQNRPADGRATALPMGAPARPPITERAARSQGAGDGKRPSEMTRADLDAFAERRRCEREAADANRKAALAITLGTQQ